MPDVPSATIPSQTPASLREMLWDIMQHGKGRMGRGFHFFLLLFILLSLAIFPLEFSTRLSRFHTTLLTLEIITGSLFTVEYLLRIYAAPKRLKYAFSFFGIIDVLSIAPFYLGFLGTQYIRAFRLIRLFRLGEIEAAALEGAQGQLLRGIPLAENERVEYVVTHHPIFLFYGCLPPLLAMTFGLAVLSGFPSNPASITVAITLFLFALLFLWKAWIDFSYDVIYVTTYRVISHDQHVLGRSINQVSYHSITNVKPHFNGLLGFLLGYGSLTIETPTDIEGSIELRIVRKHEQAAHIIMQHCGASARASEGPPAAPPQTTAE